MSAFFAATVTTESVLHCFLVLKKSIALDEAVYFFLEVSGCGFLFLIIYVLERYG